MKEEIIAYREDLLSALEDVADDLSRVTTRLPESAWRDPSLPRENTPHYILFHLRELEEQVYTRQLPRFVSEDIPTIPLFDDQAWMASHYRPDVPEMGILAEMLILRSFELERLRLLPSPAWSRLARHPWWGVHTLQWWVELQLEESFQHRNMLPPMSDL